MTDATNPASALLYLGRQPILGREQQLLAFALVLQDGMIASEGTGENVDNPLAQAFAAPASEQPPGLRAAFESILVNAGEGS